MPMAKEEMEAAANRVYPGIALFARDVNLPAALARLYTPGRILREKGFTDASSRFMGMVTTHRYVILSNHMADLSRFEHGTHLGLHVAQKDAHFKVLGQVTCQGKTGIFLLHLPDDASWKLWQTAEFVLDQQLYDMAVQRFRNKCSQPPVPELTTRAWLDRCAFPVGMSERGQFWPLEDAAEAAASRPASPDPRTVRRSRFLGCLLGGAVGDALGYPVEFLRETAIRAAYGPQGIQTLAQAGHPARISDDTQMTLFAANAIVYTKQYGGDLRENLWLAYLEWLGTQGDTSRMADPAHPKMWVYRDPRMHARRAPGNSCLSALHNSPRGGTMQAPVNQSKGCGTVMRAAPFGLMGGRDDRVQVHRMACMDAALTHGHALAWASSSMLAQIIFTLVQAKRPQGCRLEDLLQAEVPGDRIVGRLLDQAVELALNPAVSDLEAIHALGEGWVAEEALAIAIFCAVRYQDDFAAAIRAAVNHKGDSDSTGAICGNILGTWLGREAVEAAFDLGNLELRDVIEEMADELFAAAEAPEEAELPRQVPEWPVPEPLQPLRPVGLQYTPLTKKALQICFAAHENQLDKSGMPYVIHPLHVAEQMETEAEVCTALLHDVVEDSAYTLEDLRRAGFPEAVLEALQLLTRDPDTRYLDYVIRLRRNPIARRVKLADLSHNSDLARLDPITDQDRRRVLKYQMAQAILADDPYDAQLGLFRKVLPLSRKDPLFLSIFYDRQGVVKKYRIDSEGKMPSHYALDAQQAEKLRLTLAPDSTLPQALACWAEEGIDPARVEYLLQLCGIACQCQRG